MSFLILYIIFPFNFIHTSLFLPFFFLHHTRIPTLAHFLFFFYLIPYHFLYLSLSLALCFYFFFFYLILEHFLTLCVIRNRERTSKRYLAYSIIDRRTQAGVESAFTVPSCTFCSAAARLSPQRSPDGSNGFCLFFFIVMIWLILRLCFWVCILIILEFRDV